MRVCVECWLLGCFLGLKKNVSQKDAVEEQIPKNPNWPSWGESNTPIFGQPEIQHISELLQITPQLTSNYFKRKQNIP